MNIIERAKVIRDHTICSNDCANCACPGVLCMINNSVKAKANFALDTAKILEESMMEVICISDRQPVTSIIQKGEFYEIDRYSIWMDSDGDVYGRIYKNGKEICQCKISHFQSL